LFFEVEGFFKNEMVVLFEKYNIEEHAHEIVV
jgi:hypothetical protein